jgi:hypothetical protein
MANRSLLKRLAIGTIFGWVHLNRHAGPIKVQALPNVRNLHRDHRLRVLCGLALIFLNRTQERR